MIDTPMFQCLHRIARMRSVQDLIEDVDYIPSVVHDCLFAALDRELGFLEKNLEYWLRDEYFQKLLAESEAISQDI